MPRKPKSWLEYDPSYMRICQALSRHQPSSIQNLTYPEAVNKRHNFYKFLQTFRSAMFQKPEAQQEARIYMGSFTLEDAHHVTIQLKPQGNSLYYLNFYLVRPQVVIGSPPRQQLAVVHPNNEVSSVTSQAPEPEFTPPSPPQPAGPSQEDLDQIRMHEEMKLIPDNEEVQSCRELAAAARAAGNIEEWGRRIKRVVHIKTTQWKMWVYAGRPPINEYFGDSK